MKGGLVSGSFFAALRRVVTCIDSFFGGGWNICKALLLGPGFSGLPKLMEIH